MSEQVIYKNPNVLVPHPEADLIPSMRTREYEDLLEDVRLRGLQVPLDVRENTVLDGRHRLAIAKLVGLSSVPTREIVLKHDTPMGYMFRMAVLRRHLNDDQRAALAALWKRECARPRGRPPSGKKDHDGVIIPDKAPASEATRLFNVPRRKVDDATYLLHNDPDRLAAVHKGDLRLREAMRVARIEEQKVQIAEVEPPEGEFAVIVVDPPWPLDALPYPTMSINEIKELQIPAAENCLLWLWTTNGLMHAAYHVLEAWEFEPKTILTWIKNRIGMGTWLRSQTEHCILATRGKPMVDLTNQSTVLEARLREHSRKPDQFFDMVQALCPAPSFLEMFARGPRPGWECWGAESETIRSR